MCLQENPGVMDGCFSSKFISGELPLNFSEKYLSMMLHFIVLMALEKKQKLGVGVSVRRSFLI